MAFFNLTANFALIFVLTFLFTFSVSAFQFDVGGKQGWTKPSSKDSYSYNEWASENRFQIGDTLFFKYRKDSVLVVNASEYDACNTSNPISKFDDGQTVFEFDRSGYFYFISGLRGHCKSGQKMIIRVMHPSEFDSQTPVYSPVTAPAMSPADGWDFDNWGPPRILPTSSATVACIASIVLASFLVIFCLFVFGCSY